jgi:hypothetical protein
MVELLNSLGGVLGFVAGAATALPAVIAAYWRLDRRLYLIEIKLGIVAGVTD